MDGLLAVSLLLMTLTSLTRSDPGCSDLFGDSCSCYRVRSEVVLDCRRPSGANLLLASTPVASLTLHHLDSDLGLPGSLFPQNSTVRHLYISQSKLKGLDVDSFKKIKNSLESLSITEGHLTEVPQEAIVGLKKLRRLALESNLISQIPNHCFYGLLLTSLSLRKNLIEIIAEHAFIGLEDTLYELDLSENHLRFFTTHAIRRLARLEKLNLAWNKISAIPLEESAKLQPLTELDLSYNNFENIHRSTFRSTPSLTSLSLSNNKISVIESGSFANMKQLQNLYLSSNRLMKIDVEVFQANEFLDVVDLSHNHIHTLQDMFICNPRLREVYLGDNNVIELSEDTFANNSFLSVIDLRRNSLRSIHHNAFINLNLLSHLCLSENFLTNIPPVLFIRNTKLLSLNLEGNLIQSIEQGTFFALERLKELKVQNNAISKIWRSTFYPLPSLVELSVANNLIDNINPEAFISLKKMEKLDLQGNFLNSLEGLFLHAYLNDEFEGNISLVSKVQCLQLNNNRFTKLTSDLFGDMSLVKKIYLTNNSISSIEDNTFITFKSLMFLDLSFNQIRFITTKTFPSLFNLEELYLSKNDIKHIEARAFSGLRRLRVLDLSNNLIVVLHKDIFQQGLPIRILNLKNCSIVKVDKGTFKGMTNLNELNLEYNILDADSVAVFDIPGLRRLRLGNNNLTIIKNTTFKRLPSLQLLSLDNNGIRDIPSDAFVYNQRLYFLSLSRNWIKHFSIVTLSVLSGLKELRLNQNEFSQIPYEALSELSHLESLVLSENFIRTFNASRFVSMRKLKFLQMQRNFISSLSGFAAAQWPHLVSVDFSRNSLSALPVNFFHFAFSLKNIDLSSNKLAQIPSVALSDQNMPNLNHLKIGSNPLTRVNQHNSFKLHPSLQELHLTGSNLTKLTESDFLAFPALMHLTLSKNMINTIGDGTFDTLPKLISLDLSKNEIASFPTIHLQNLNHLKILNLSFNRIKDIEEFTHGSGSLRVLDLSFNHIMRIGKSAFNQLKGLTELYLHGNWLSYVAPTALKYQMNLRILQMHKNYFDDLPLRVFRAVEPQLTTLTTEGNPLRCQCEQQELWYWLQDHQRLVDRGPRCEGPPQLRGLWFLGLEPPEFCSLPLVPRLRLDRILATSLVVSWDSQNKSGVTAFAVAYHTLEHPSKVMRVQTEQDTRSLILQDLSVDTWYLVCVLALGRWTSPPLHNSRTSRCTQVRTLYQVEVREAGVLVFSRRLASSSAAPWALSSSSYSSTCSDSDDIDDDWCMVWQVRTLDQVEVREAGVLVFSRRLGLIVGSAMGFVVFLLLVCVLGYIKVKKQRKMMKRGEIQDFPSGCHSYHEENYHVCHP